MPGPGGQKWQGTEGPDGRRGALAASSDPHRYRALRAASSSLMSSPEPETRMTRGRCCFLPGSGGRDRSRCPVSYAFPHKPRRGSCLLPLTEGVQPATTRSSSDGSWERSWEFSTMVSTGPSMRNCSKSNGYIPWIYRFCVKLCILKAFPCGSKRNHSAGAKVPSPRRWSCEMCMKNLE